MSPVVRPGGVGPSRPGGRDHPDDPSNPSDPSDPGEPGDLALLHAHLAGDPSAFGVLFTRHRDRLWAVALRTTGNPEDAADALQDGLISAFRRAESFREESAVTTWLHRIVVNASLDRLRRNKVRAAEPLPEDLDDHARRGGVLTGAQGGPAAGGDPEGQALAGERRERVLAALEELPPDQKAALVLVDMEGYPVSEAAQILEVAEGTVKSRCSRGRSRLAALLGDLRPGADDGSGTSGAHAASDHRPRGPAPAPGTAAPVVHPDQPSSAGGEHP